MERELFTGIPNRLLYLGAGAFALVLMFLGLVTPAVTGTDGAALLVQEGVSIVGSGTWASLYLLTCSGLLLAWMWRSHENPLLARLTLATSGGVVLLIAAVQGVAVSDLLEAIGSYGDDGIGLGPAYWLLGAGGAVLFVGSVLACWSELPEKYQFSIPYTFSIRRRESETDDE